jgi:ribosomal protein L21
MAVIPSAVPSRTIGGIDSVGGGIIVPANDTTYFAIFAGVLSSSTGNFYPFYKNGTQYQVTTGKTCRVEQINLCSTANTNLELQLVSSLTSYAQNAASITSGTYQGGAVSISAMNTGPTANVFRLFQVPYEFGALSYPGFQALNNTQAYRVILICREI